MHCSKIRHNEMDRLLTYKVFAQVAERGSFTAAADALSLSKANVSFAIRELETALGARLFHRTTRTVRLSQDGAALFERVKNFLEDFEELEASFQDQQASLSGRLRVDLPTGAARNLILPKLPEFCAQHPDLLIEISCTDRRVDVIAEGFDLVLRIGSMKDSSLIARQIGNLALVNVASPVYLQKFGMPQSIQDLSKHRLVHYVQTLGGAVDGFEYFDGNTFVVQPMQGSIIVNNTDAYEAACLAGMGITQMPLVGAYRFIEQGLLAELLPECRAEAMPVQLVYASRKHLSRRVRVFMDWLEAVLRPWLVRSVTS
jgi:DNA-binding transcriptional LysR family regulator